MYSVFPIFSYINISFNSLNLYINYLYYYILTRYIMHIYTKHCTVYIIHCILYIFDNIPHNYVYIIMTNNMSVIIFAKPSRHFTLFRVDYSLYTIHCNLNLSLYTINLLLYTVLCIVYTTQSGKLWNYYYPYLNQLLYECIHSCILLVIKYGECEIILCGPHVLVYLVVYARWENRSKCS